VALLIHLFVIFQLVQNVYGIASSHDQFFPSMSFTINLLFENIKYITYDIAWQSGELSRYNDHATVWTTEKLGFDFPQCEEVLLFPHFFQTCSGAYSDFYPMDAGSSFRGAQTVVGID
jgi:hypothetical protein